ncbi:hypothetical protein ACN28G_19775 [Micromonospora sp. WMMA1923]
MAPVVISPTVARGCCGCNHLGGCLSCGCKCRPINGGKTCSCCRATDKF